MKLFVKTLSVVSMVALTACGTSTSSESEISAARKTKSPAVIENAVATRINSSAYPSVVAYELTGKVMTGSNRCQAEGVKVKFEKTQVGRTMTVVANLISPATTTTRICTREFAPQYADISHKIIFNSNKIDSVFVANVDTLNNNVDLTFLIKNITTLPAVIEELKVLPVNGGINPNFGAVLVQAKVMLGSNACMAGSNTAELESKLVGQVIVVRAVLKVEQALDSRMCTMQFAPVYADLETVVKYNKLEVKKINVENVNEMGNTISIKNVL